MKLLKFLFVILSLTTFISCRTFDSLFSKDEEPLKHEYSRLIENTLMISSGIMGYMHENYLNKNYDENKKENEIIKNGDEGGKLKILYHAESSSDKKNLIFKFTSKCIFDEFNFPEGIIITDAGYLNVNFIMYCTNSISEVKDLDFEMKGKLYYKKNEKHNGIIEVKLKIKNMATKQDSKRLTGYIKINGLYIESSIIP